MFFLPLYVCCFVGHIKNVRPGTNAHISNSNKTSITPILSSLTSDNMPLHLQKVGSNMPGFSLSLSTLFYFFFSLRTVQPFVIINKKNIENYFIQQVQTVTYFWKLPYVCVLPFFVFCFAGHTNNIQPTKISNSSKMGMNPLVSNCTSVNMPSHLQNVGSNMAGFLLYLFYFIAVV